MPETLVQTPDFAELSPRARVWLYGFRQPLSLAEQQLVSESLARFFARWRSHGAKVRADFALLEDRFAVLAGEVPGEDVSGCGIDASVRVFKALRDESGLDALDHGLIHYRQPDGAVASVSRPAFKRLVAAGVIGPSTPVFDLTITDMATWRKGVFESPFAESWHVKAFPLP